MPQTVEALSHAKAAGVPIVGYANEAFAGLTRLGPFGWSTPLGDVSSLADEIARLARDREALARAATSALRFAREHTFESTFKRRIDHLSEVASQGPRAIRAPWRNIVALGRRGRSPTSAPL
jgi:glycosyltransferase involved in cell wall biosynthesis